MVEGDESEREREREGVAPANGIGKRKKATTNMEDQEEEKEEGVKRRADGNLVRAIRMVDAALSTHELPVFYADPRPHVSLMWAPGDVEERLNAVV